MGKENYIFKTDSEAEAERLKRLNEVYNPNSQNVLKKFLKPGMQVLEIGPGSGELGKWITEQIGEGQYYGLDPDAIAIEQANKRGIKNATFIQGSLLDIDEIKEFKDKKFDVIYFRWVLAYTPKERYHEMLGKLYRLLAQNGQLICEECNLYKAACVDPKNDKTKISHVAFDKWLALSKKVDETLNANFDLGKKLEALLKEVGGENSEVITEKFQPIFKDPYFKNILVFGMQSAKNTLTEKQIIKEKDAEQLTSELQELANDPNTAVAYIKNTIATVRHP